MTFQRWLTRRAQVVAAFLVGCAMLLVGSSVHAARAICEVRIVSYA